MKKCLSILLVLAMVLSCVSMISLIASAKDDEWSANLIEAKNSTFEEYEVGDATNVGKQGSPTMSVVLDGENKVLSFTSAQNYMAPKYATKALVKAYAESKGWETVVVEYSMDVKIEDADTGATTSTAGILIRDVVARYNRGAADTKDVSGNKYVHGPYAKGFGQWTTLTMEAVLTAEDLASTDNYGLTLDSLAKTGDTYKGYIDNVSVRVKEYVPETFAGVIFTGNGNGYYYRRVTAGLKASDLTDGKFAVAYAVYNAGTVPASTQFMFQNGWTTVKGTSGILLQPGEVGVLTGSLDLSSVSAEDLPKLVARFDIKENNDGSIKPSSATKVCFKAIGSEGLDKVLDVMANGDALFEAVKELPTVGQMNGDAEDGLAGWTTFITAGGNVETVEGGANETDHAVKFTPTTTNVYQSIGYNLSPSIVNDADLYMAGLGAEKYTVTFYAKAEEGKGGKFTAMLNSQYHADKDAKIGDYTLTQGTYLTSSTIELTDEWQQFSVDFTVSAAYLENLKNALANGASNAMKLILRLDGSGSARAFGASGSATLFSYYLDEVEITKYVEPETPTTDQETPVGVKLTYTGAHYAKTGSGVFTAEDVEDGKLTKTYTIYNTSDIDLKVRLAIETLHNSGWTGPSSPEITIPAGKKAELTVEATVTDGKISVKDTPYELNKFFLRVDVKNTENKTAPDGTTVVIAFGEDQALLEKVNNGAAVTNELVYELPVVEDEPSVDEPSYYEVFNGDAEDGGTGNWGIFTAGKIELVEPGANSTAHAIKYTPTDNKYGSIAFDLGPAIVQDKEAGFNGAGAGDYKIEFYAKAESGKGGKFAFTVNSQKHMQKGAQVGEYTTTMNTYQSFKTIELTDDWQLFSIDFTMTEEFLENIANVYKNGGDVKAYQLVVRLDGAAFAFKEGTFPYYLDEIVLTTPEVSEEGEKEEPLKAGGVRFQVVSDLDNKDSWMISGKGVVSAADVKNGEVTKEFRVFNEGTEDVQIRFTLQTTAKNAAGNATWAGPNGGEKVLIEAGSSEIISYTMEVENGKVEVNGDMYDLNTFFIRLDITGADSGKEMPGDGSINFVIAANGNDAELLSHMNINSAVREGWGVETVMTRGGALYNSGDQFPVALIAALVATVAALTAVVVIRKKKEQ